jgi:hypothetical protein
MYGLEVMPIKKKEMEQMEIMQRKLNLKAANSIGIASVAGFVSDQFGCLT